ncbi:hypothetical protein KBZ21_44515, partial [Streptomyces sp. A73]|nr:hypothetical protein [Streptomyces sp. A73]
HVKIRTYAVVAALSLLPLAGCGDDDSDDNYKAKPSKAAGDNTASDADKKKAAASKTEMNVGDTFRYHDGIKVTVTS